MEANNEIARLDVAARALAGEATGSGLRFFLPFYSVLLTILAFGSEASPKQTMLVGAAAIVLWITTAVQWTNWRYKLYLTSVVLLVWMVGFCCIVGASRPAIYYAAVICLGLYALVKSLASWRLAIVSNAPGWEKEQSQARTWREVLMARQRTQDVTEFSTGSFSAGYYTYRLMSPGPYWVIAKFKRGQFRTLLEFRVRELGEVSFHEGTTGQMSVRIADRTLPADNFSAPALGDPAESPLARTA